MKLLRTHFQHWVVFFVISLVLVGYPLYGQAMSLFMGGEEQKTAPPPPKPATAKPQVAPGQPSVSPTAPAGAGQAPAPGAPASPTAPAAPASGAPASPPAAPVAPQAVAKPPAAGTPAPVSQAKPGPTNLPASTPAVNAPKSVTAPISSLPVPATGVTGQPGQGGSAVEAAVPTPPLAEAVDGYTYDPKSRREPFQSLARLVKIVKKGEEVPPLQLVQISDLKLLGIIWGGYGYHGLVRTPDGKGYTVKEGMLMGTNNGVISAITDKAVIVSEPSIDITGNKITKDVEILLRPKEVS